jgi:hypothetical protein
LVAPPGNRSDQLSVRAKGFAQCRNLARQAVLFDDPAPPDAAQQLVFADDRPGLLDQRHQQVEGAPTEPYGSAVGEQFAAMRQDAERAEVDDRRWVRLANHDGRL